MAGGLQALPKRGSYQLARAAADAYARSQSGGDDDEGSSSKPEIASPAPPSPGSSSDSDKADVSGLPACFLHACQDNCTARHALP